MNDLPIKTKEDFVTFARAYNRFVTFFLVSLVLGIPLGIMMGAETTVPAAFVLFVPFAIINIITLILMFIAASKSKSSHCNTMCYVYLATILFIPSLSFIAQILALVAFSQTFKKYNIKVNFYVPQETMDAIWFCSCGNVCLEGNCCPKCCHYKDECGE